jgi:hypothetical protein
MLARVFALIALVSTVLGAQAAGAQALSQTARASIQAAQVAFAAKQYGLAADLYVPACQEGLEAACGNRRASLYNEAQTLIRCGDTEAAAECASRNRQAAANYQEICSTARGEAYAAQACKEVELSRNMARVWDVADLTSPPNPGQGCLNVDPVTYMANLVCDRAIFVHFCVVEKAKPNKGCTYYNGGMGWTSYRPSWTTPELIPSVEASERGRLLVYWYECYGFLARFNTETGDPNLAVTFDPKTGWRNVRCTTRNGTPTTPIYRSTLRAGSLGPSGD